MENNEKTSSFQPLTTQMKKTLISLGIMLVLFGVLFFFIYPLSQKGIFKRSPQRPNILLITVCSLRQDHLGCYGYPRNTSPNIDKLAKTSIRFENCRTHIPWTKPSTIALMTGQYPFGELEGKKENTISQRLRSAGYLTCGIVGTNMVRDAAKVDVGFDTFLDHLDLKTVKDSHSVQADTLVDKGMAWLGQAALKKKPIFLWLFFKDPHWPYLPPADSRETFTHDPWTGQQSQQLAINDHFNDSIGGIGEARLKSSGGGFITDKAYYVAQYDAEILSMDRQIGRLLEFLKRRKGYEDWVIVLSADHGESLGENNYFFDHGYLLSEGTTRIPLLIKLPQHGKGEVRKTPASICDIYPTLMELAGVHDEAYKDNVHGVSLLSQARRQKDGHGDDWAMMLENSPTHEAEHVKLLGCIWKSYKLIQNGTTREKTLYHVSNENIPLGGSSHGEREASDRMSGFIGSFYDDPETLDNVSSEELRSLGYLQ